MNLRICVSILPKNNLEALKRILRAEQEKADFIEVRLDNFETTSKLSEVAQSTKVPLIATTKLVGEQGFFEGTDQERQQTLLNAAQSGFQYIDVDLTSSLCDDTVVKIRGLGARPIISFHKYDGALSFQELTDVLQREIASGAEVCKIVSTADTIADTLPIINFTSSHAEKAKLVCFCMGSAGKISRFLSPLFGAYFTFAALDETSKTAPGQMTIREMRAVYKTLGDR